MNERVTIMRGLPGSGKGHFAKLLAAETGAVIVSMDQFFENEDGEYVWDRTKIGEAQVDCMVRYVDALQRGYSVIVDNTHTRLWEFASYVRIAEVFKANVEVIEITTPGIDAVKVFAERNVHGVPAEAILKMWYRWEDCVDPKISVAAMAPGGPGFVEAT